MFISNWPSCGRRRSTMFMSAMILMRLTSAWPISGGSSTTSFSAPSMRKRTRTQSSAGLDVHVGRAVAQRLRDDLVDDLHDRRVRVDDVVDRGVVGVDRDLAGLERFDVGADRGQRAVGLVDAVAQLRGNAERDVHFVDRQRTQQRASRRC